MPVGHPPSEKENRELAAALQSYRQRAIADDFSALEQFLTQHPDSAWRAAVQFNLAVEYYNTGWYSKALDAWQKTWPLLKNETGPVARSLADRAASELAYMYGRLGRLSELAALLREVEGRVFIGSATEKISGARQGLWTMQHRPEIAFRCGPFALEQILLNQKSTNAGSLILHEAPSTTNGCSLNEVVELSRRIGMNYQMAFRRPGAALLMPAVVNWKLGHYAALIKEAGGLYLLQDPTFGNDAWVSRRVLEEESSGYFLVPPGNLPPGWRTVSAEEGSNIFGKGTTSDADQDSTTCNDWLACGLHSLFQWASGLVGSKDSGPQDTCGQPGGVCGGIGIRGMAAATCISWS